MGESEMTRISRIAKPLGIAMAVVGLAMIAISGFYLFEYARSGSDADEFNVVAASPEDYLELVGQSIPNPNARIAADEAMQAEEVLSGEITASVGGVEPFDREREIDRAETVSIASMLPGIGSVSRPAEEPASLGAAADVDGDDAVLDRDVAARMVAPAAARDKQTVGGAPAPALPSSSLLVETFASIYPGGNMNPRYWSEPHWAGNLPFGGPTIPDDFMPVDSTATEFAALSGELGLRMRIPAIDLDATVSELELLDLGDSRAWSTPDRVVGHIPTTANPGESANGWYFGHLSNFLSNEGDIFRRLPEIAGMIKNDPVDIFITTSNAEYMYRVTQSELLHRDDLSLTETSNAQISLVTCWPFRVYDHRVLVSAVLVAVKPLPEA